MKGWTNISPVAIRHNETGMILILPSDMTPDRAIEQLNEDLGIDPTERCGCGCGLPLNPGSRFRPGHDARLKSDLMARFRRGDQLAFNILKSYGWHKFLRPEELERMGEEL